MRAIHGGTGMRPTCEDVFWRERSFLLPGLIPDWVTGRDDCDDGLVYVSPASAP
jgi:hypothetical protein